MRSPVSSDCDDAISIGTRGSPLLLEEVMLGYCLWRGYVPAGDTYLLCSLFAPVRELAGGCRRKQDVETSAATATLQH